MHVLLVSLCCPAVDRYSWWRCYSEGQALLAQETRLSCIDKKCMHMQAWKTLALQGPV